VRMRVVITGGGGFLGQVLASEILKRGHLRSGEDSNVPVTEVVIGDVMEVKEWLFDSLQTSSIVTVKVGDVCDASYCASLLNDDNNDKDGGLCVFHLGAVMSGAGEADFDLAMNVNLKGMMNMLEATRQFRSSSKVIPTFVYASAGATIGSGCDTDWIQSGDVISDSTRAAPHTTYGMTKACGELLLSDYSRRGFLDGRGVRLPTVIVRPGKPNAATTSCFSSVIREPLSGTAIALPIDGNLKHALTSYTAAVDGMLAFQTASPSLANQVLGPYDRTAFLPSMAVSLADLQQALSQIVDTASSSALGFITYNIDKKLSNIVQSFPTSIDSSRAIALGAPPTPGLATIIRQYCTDFPNAIHPQLKLVDSPASTTETENYKDAPNLIVAIVTGAGSGIGRATAIKFSTGGWGGPTGKGFAPPQNTTYGIVLVGRRLDPLYETQQLCIEAAASQKDHMKLHTLVISADVTCEKSVSELFTKVKTTFGRLDLLFNNAGANVPPAPFQNVPMQDYHKVMNANVTSTFLCSQQAIKLMSSPYVSPSSTTEDEVRKGGRIINNGSISSDSPRPGASPYTISKHAVLGLTKSIALDGRDCDIACGQIDLGNVSSALQQTALGNGGQLQANGSRMLEPNMTLDDAATSVFAMACLPPGANVLRMTMMATKMPFVGRG